MLFTDGIEKIKKISVLRNSFGGLKYQYTLEFTYMTFERTAT